MKTAIYSRVSSIQQNHESQEREVTSYAKRAGWEDVEIYRDTISGKKEDRDALTRLLQDCRSGKVQRILCYKMDRLGRSTQHLFNLIAELTSMKVPIIFTSQGISTEESNHLTKFFLTVMAGFAELETAQRGERQMIGIANRKAKGLPMGPPAPPIEVQNKIVDLSLTGLSQRKIAEQVGCSQSYVGKLLKSKK